MSHWLSQHANHFYKINNQKEGSVGNVIKEESSELYFHHIFNSIASFSYRSISFFYHYCNDNFQTYHTATSHIHTSAHTFNLKLVCCRNVLSHNKLLFYILAKQLQIITRFHDALAAFQRTHFALFCQTSDGCQCSQAYWHIFTDLLFCHIKAKLNIFVH